jgi:hypothetical protein
MQIEKSIEQEKVKEVVDNEEYLNIGLSAKLENESFYEEFLQDHNNDFYDFIREQQENNQIQPINFDFYLE